VLQSRRATGGTPMRGRAVAARRAHNPEVLGSNPSPATRRDHLGTGGLLILTMVRKKTPREHAGSLLFHEPAWLRSGVRILAPLLKETTLSEGGPFIFAKKRRRTPRRITAPVVFGAVMISERDESRLNLFQPIFQMKKSDGEKTRSIPVAESPLRDRPCACPAER
jgi:hypothetical protein